MPGRLLDVPAPVLRAGEQHLLELTLPDDGVQRAADPDSVSSSWTSRSRTTWPPMRYSLSPERKIARLTSISVMGTGITPAELSITSLTSAMPRAARAGLPAKITSAICPPRSARGPCSPSTQADRVDEVRLPRPVRADDDGDAGGELQDGLVRERLEATDLRRAAGTSGRDANSGRAILDRPVRPLSGPRAARQPEDPERRSPVGGSCVTTDRSTSRPGPARHHRTSASTSAVEPLERRLDAAVGRVADPAGDPAPARLRAHEDPEEHALHPAGDGHARAASRRHHVPLGRYVLSGRPDARRRARLRRHEPRSSWSTCRTTSPIRAAACTCAAARRSCRRRTPRSPRRWPPARSSSTRRTGIRRRRRTSRRTAAPGRSTACAETWGAELHPDLSRRRRRVMRKGTGGEDGYSAFSVRDPGSGRRRGHRCSSRMLRDARRRALVVAGLATDYCVGETALTRAELGFRDRRCCARRSAPSTCNRATASGRSSACARPAPTRLKRSSAGQLWHCGQK